MAVRRFSVEYRSDNGNQSLRIFMRSESVNGTPEIKIDSGAYQEPTVSSTDHYFEFTNPSLGTREIFYRDDNGEVKLCDFVILDFESLGVGQDACVLKIYGLEVGPNSTSRDSVVFTSGVPVTLSNGVAVPSSKLPLCASFDGFSTQKCGTSTNFASSACVPSTFSNKPTKGVPFSMSYKFNSGSCGNIMIGDNILYNDIAEPLSVSSQKTNVTSNGGSDGTIQLIIDGGSGDYSVSWDDGPATVNRSGLSLGSYDYTVTDNQTSEEVSGTVFINEPDAPLVEEQFFFVPVMQSFHFVKKVTPNHCDVFQGLDNMLFCEQDFPYFRKVNYYQKVLQCDSPTIQIKSSTPDITVSLKDYRTGSVVANFIPELKVQNTGRLENFPINIQNNGSSQSRVYFSDSPQIPALVNVGDSFEITGNSDGFNGVYEVIGVQEESTTGNQYIIINKNYGISAPSTPGTAEFTTNLVLFDIYEVLIEFGSVPFGTYYLDITSENSDQGFLESAVSEPIKVINDPKGLNLIKWTNFDSAYDINYTTGITHQVRVESLFFKRLPGADREQLRNTNGSLSTLTSKPRRKINFELFQLTPYLHEKLAIAFEHDSVSVQGIPVITEDGYQEPQYLTRFPLSNSMIVLEQLNYLNDSYNGDDLGAANQGDGLLIVNEGFLKL